MKNIIVTDPDEGVYFTNVGRAFLVELIEKYQKEQKQLSENLKLYENTKNEKDYKTTFSNWNRGQLFLWDLKDALCRMGVDID